MPTSLRPIQRASELSPNATPQARFVFESNAIHNQIFVKLSEKIRKDNEIPKNTDLKDTNLMNESVPEEVSLFNRFLKEGFDGITTNPNYKLLALLIILLINLSLFLLVGNLGKSFLENSGLLN